MIELYEDPQMRKMQLRILDLDSEIRDIAGQLAYNTYSATPEQAEKLAALILERNNLRIAMDTK